MDLVATSMGFPGGFAAQKRQVYGLSEDLYVAPGIDRQVIHDATALRKAERCIEEQENLRSSVRLKQKLDWA